MQEHEINLILFGKNTTRMKRRYPLTHFRCLAFKKYSDAKLVIHRIKTYHSLFALKLYS